MVWKYDTRSFILFGGYHLQNIHQKTASTVIGRDLKKKIYVSSLE